MYRFIDCLSLTCLNAVCIYLTLGERPEIRERVPVKGCDRLVRRAVRQYGDTPYINKTNRCLVVVPIEPRRCSERGHSHIPLMSCIICKELVDPMRLAS